MPRKRKDKEKGMHHYVNGSSLLTVTHILTVKRDTHFPDTHLKCTVDVS